MLDLIGFDVKSNQRKNRKSELQVIATTWGCAWIPICKEEATHWHHVYGELCPRHAAEVMKQHPKDKLERLVI